MKRSLGHCAAAQADRDSSIPAVDPSAIGAIATRINYDILTYLPQDLDSMIGEVALEDDFHLASTGMIAVEGLPTNELIAMKKDIEAVPGVTQTFWLSDVIDPSIPTEMLPADVQQFMFGKNDSTMLIVRFDAPSASDETMEAVAQIEKLLRKDCFFGGMSVILQDTKALVNQEMPMYILIAVGASLLVLFLSLESTITPLLFMLGLLFPIAYNFGTNIFLGQIGYITEALATVLQLGVTMDFSIFLLHRYQEEKELRSSNEEAMSSAICKTMTSISASSLTTIAGFLALCAMRLTLGRDIGLVMAKGVALGVICTVVILPSPILTFDKWVEKYKHRTVMQAEKAQPLCLQPLGAHRGYLYPHPHPLCHRAEQDRGLLHSVRLPAAGPDRHRGHQQAGRGLRHDHQPLYSGA